ncbi:MAG TPA: TerB family tellurite resistance protein [Longimicrobiaceae bacterium]
MLLDRIRSLFGGAPTEADRPAAPAASNPGATPAHEPVDPLHLAACALLLEVAHADGEFSDAERAHLEAVLERHFALPPESGRRVMELAEGERSGAIDQYRFTSVLQERYDTGQKMVLAEIMWGLVLADGQIAEHEHYLTRKISNLLGLAPGYLSAAKAAAARGREE